MNIRRKPRNTSGGSSQPMLTSGDRLSIQMPIVAAMMKPGTISHLRLMRREYLKYAIAIGIAASEVATMRPAFSTG